MTRILLTNDDGFFAAGLRVTRDALDAVEGWDIVVVAPDREQSASSHALTLHRPLRLDQIDTGMYKVDGTPTDCVLLATKGGLAVGPDIVVSGVNAGGNMGDDVTYSGTVAAAMEGTLLGLPSIALSLVGEHHFEAAAAVGVHIVKLAIERGMPPDTLLNVNVPDLPLAEIKGMAITTQSSRTYHDQVIAKRDPRGRAYFWIAGDTPQWHAGDGSDYAAVRDGFVSITPLHLDLTNAAATEYLNKWPLSLN